MTATNRYCVIMAGGIGSRFWPASRRHLPEVYGLFAGQADRFATPEEPNSVEDIFARCPSISIDYGVLERVDNVFVRSSDFGWNDVGTWGSLYELSAKDADGNVVPAYSELYDTTNSLVKAVGKRSSSWIRCTTISLLIRRMPC